MNIDVKDTALMRHLKATGAAYYGKALELADAVQGWLNYIPETFPHYTRHTIQHSEEIISQISMLIFDEVTEQAIVKITPVEAYVLIAAAYLHDSGMVAADSEKLEIITSNEEWKRWVSEGGAAKRWQEILEIRNNNSLTEEARNFVADLQTRFLLAEFIRRQHHLRAGNVIKQHEAHLGRFAFNDLSLVRTIADVCISHGLRHFELEDDDRFPERRVIQGHKVNVRMMAILLRLGDLLDMSYDRACPLLLNAASPIPADSLAHWTQYQRIIHRSTSPRKIEITAECEKQEEHRVLQDWCQWIVEEVNNASVLMSHSESASKWQPPQASIGGSGTIKIRPAPGATYIPSTWSFEMDKEAILQLLIKDVYQNPLVFIRELIQNALDANRSQMYIDLRKQGLAEPAYPTQVEQSRRDRYQVKVALEPRQIHNSLSGEVEEKQVLIVEDNGIGMDREIIERYFLQVGRSYYTSEAFRSKFRFIPTSRFGIGFLSVFAVSDWVTVETYKPSSSNPEALCLTITGPRNYLLTERGERLTNGTRIEVHLREPLEKEEAHNAIVDWCKRVEFKVNIDILGAQKTIIAEKADDFIFERPDIKDEKAQFFLNVFSLEHQGLEGEIYILGRRDDSGEAWAGPLLVEEENRHPIADVRRAPSNLICLHGISLTDRVPNEIMFGENVSNEENFSCRLDIRDKNYQPPLARTWALLSEEHKEALLDRLKQALNEHLATTELVNKADFWKYKNDLAHGYKLKSFWESCLGMIPLYRAGQFDTVSLEQIQCVDTVTSVHKKFKNPYEVLWRNDDNRLNSTLINNPEAKVILGSDLAILAEIMLSSLLDTRIPTNILDIGDENCSIEWQKINPDSLEYMSNRIFVSEAYRGYSAYMGMKVNDIKNDRHIAYFIIGAKTRYWVRGLWNVNNPFVDWLIKVKDAYQTNSYELGSQFYQVFRFLNDYSTRYGGQYNLNKLNIYLKGWKDILGLPNELYPPELEIAEDMFVFLG